MEGGPYGVPPVALTGYRGTADGPSRLPSLRSAASPILTDRRGPRWGQGAPTGGAAASGKSRWVSIPATALGPCERARAAPSPRPTRRDDLQGIREYRLRSRGLSRV